MITESFKEINTGVSCIDLRAMRRQSVSINPYNHLIYGILADYVAKIVPCKYDVIHPLTVTQSMQSAGRAQAQL